MRLLDRYIVRNFLQPYLYCILGFLSIWLIFDISDNSAQIFDARTPLAAVVRYYPAQIPEVLVILLPVSLLLALLFSFGRMSRANEIVSMLTAGVSVPRVTLPLLLIGLITTGVTLALNYSLAAHAERARKIFFDDINHGGRRDVVISGQVFRNRTDNRTWFIARFRPGTNQFNGLQIVQQDENQNIVRNYLASDASYDPASKTWRLSQAKVVNYDGAGNITNEKMEPDLRISDWSETPYRLSSANVRPEFLGDRRAPGIPALQLRFSARLARSFLHPAPVSLGPALDLFRGRHHGHAARDRLLAARDFIERGGGDYSRVLDEFPHPSFPRARGRGPRLALRRRLGAEPDLSRDRALPAPAARDESRSAQL